MWGKKNTQKNPELTKTLGHGNMFFYHSSPEGQTSDSKALKCLFSFVTVAGEMGIHHRRKRERTSSNGNIQTSEQIAIRHGSLQREHEEPMHLTSVPYLAHTLGPLTIPP
jgi:hypothetical protein